MKAKSVDLKAVFRAVAPRKSTLPIIQNLAVADGVAWAIDTDIYAVMPTDLPDGMYRLVGKNFEVHPEYRVENMPIAPPMGGAAVASPIPFPREALKAALNFMVENPARPLWGAVCLRVKTDKMEIAATDQFALTRHAVDRPGSIPEGDYILPNKAVRTLLLDKHSETVTLSATDKHVALDTGALRVITRRIDGVYYPIDSVIPRWVESVSVFNAKELSEAVNTLTPYASEEDRCIRIAKAMGGYELSARDTTRSLEKSLFLKASTYQGGSVVPLNLMLIMPMSGPNGQPDGTLRLQHRYLKQVCRSVTGPSLYMGLQGSLEALQAVVFSGEPLTGGDQE